MTPVIRQSISEVAQLCLTLCNPMDCSLPGSSIHGIFEARILDWGAIAFSDPLSSKRQRERNKDRRLQMNPRIQSCWNPDPLLGFPKHSYELYFWLKLVKSLVSIMRKLKDSPKYHEYLHVCFGMPPHPIQNLSKQFTST